MTALVLASALMLVSVPWEEQSPESSNYLWSDKTCSQWEERYPVGNGWVGAMVDVDSLQLNHYRIWTGKPHDYSVDGAYKWPPRASPDDS